MQALIGGVDPDCTAQCEYKEVVMSGVVIETADELDGRRFVVQHYDAHSISVLHDGTITWDELYSIKNEIWGELVNAIELYPSRRNLVNNAVQRHLWRAPEGMPLPDLLDPDYGLWKANYDG